MSSIDGLLADLARARIGTTFNQFREATRADVPGAPEIRLANLRRYLAERASAEVVAIGEAAGYRGMRWSGIAFTGEADLIRWQGYQRTFAGEPPWDELSGGTVHRLLESMGAERRVVLWNTVPTHPHKDGIDLSNRRPHAVEIRLGQAFSLRLLSLLKPRQVIAIGRVADTVLRRHGVPHTYVRHPSHGGARRFTDEMGAILQ